MQRYVILLLTPVIFLVLSHEVGGKDLDHADLQKSIFQIVEKVRPATVAVSVSRREPGMGVFSAVIVTPEGHILTAGHAVDPGRSYRVILTDGRQVAAKGLGREETIDCGLIKITERGPWPYAEMGWSANLKKNQPCLGFGHPGPFDDERGPVLRFGRIVDPVSPRSGFIQTTCLMEPGDSGGPVFDWNGRVIGIRSRIEQSLDVNYEVPVDQYRRFWTQLNEPKTFRASNVTSGPQFGLTFSRRGRGRGRGNWGWGRGRGVMIAEVAEESVAFAAGLKKDDRITAVGGEAVSSSLETDCILYSHFVLKKETALLTIRREDEELTIPLPIPREETTAKEDNKVDAGPKAIRLSSPSESEIPPIAALEDLGRQFLDTENRLDQHSAEVTSTLRNANQRSLALVLATDKPDASAEKTVTPGVFLVSKSSLVGDEPTVRFRNGETAEASVVARSQELDLVLLNAERQVDGGVSLDKVRATPRDSVRLGRLLLTPRPQNRGLVSVFGSFPFDVEKTRDSAGFLGVKPEVKNNQVVLSRIYPNTAASRAKLEPGDIMLSVDGVKLRAADEMIRVLGKRLPGDKITIILVRDEEELTKDVVLGERDDVAVHAADRFTGGKSKRRDGFPQVFCHDARLRPYECGGPLFSLDGDFVGLNIARASRTRTYAIPAAQVRTFVSDAMKNVP